MKQKIAIVSILILIITSIVLFKKEIFPFQPQKLTPQVSQEEKLKIVSTSPDPLEGATILPTQYIEVTFSKPLFVSEFKHRLDPEVDHEVKVINGRDHAFGSTFRIIFKKPLELGSGYTFFILSNTKTEEGIGLEHDFIYHFSTISYRGV